MKKILIPLLIVTIFAVISTIFGCKKSSPTVPTSTGTINPTATVGAQETATMTAMFVTSWGGLPAGSGIGKLNDPLGVAVDKNGNVYVVDNGNNRVQEFSSAGIYMNQWGGLPAETGAEPNGPFGIAIDNSGNIYVTDLSNNSIQEFAGGAGTPTQLGGSGSGNGYFNEPYGIAVDKNGNVYVADSMNNMIQKFNSSGTFVSQWGSSYGNPGSGNGQLNYPVGVAVDGSGNVYVVDKNNYRIQKFSSADGITYTYVSQLGLDPYGNRYFASPWGIAVDSNGNVYVSDQGNYNIQVFSSIDGITYTYKTQWGTYGRGNGLFENPWGVAADNSGDIYVTDNGNNNIQKFKP
jgi:DNA-binding beta-propeller fold protein YncE